MVGVVTVMGASGAHVPVTVNGGVAFSLAQAYASAVNGLGGTLFSQNLTAGIAPATVPGGKVAGRPGKPFPGNREVLDAVVHRVVVPHQRYGNMMLLGSAPSNTLP